MTDLEKQINSDRKAEYNKEPVHYCTNCLSLKIVREDDFDYCDECGSVEIAQASIEDWDKMYKEKYNKSYYDNSKTNI